MNNPDSINPFVADMIVKYWNRRMTELKSEQEKQAPPDKRLNFSTPKESPYMAGIRKSEDMEKLEKKLKDLGVTFEVKEVESQTRTSS